MNRSTHIVWGLLAVLILGAGSAGLGQDIYLLGDGVAGDPNEPTPPDVNAPWDPAEHLAAGWRSMTLSTQLWNAAAPERSHMPPVRSLSFAGRIDVIDPNGLIGLSEVATDALAFDEAGKQLATVRVSEDPPSYQPLQYGAMMRVPGGEWEVIVEPGNFSLDLLMEPNAPFPVVLSRLEWSTAVLLSDHFEVIDIPFAPTDGWIELTPGLEILVEQAVAEEENYRYQMKARYNRSHVSYLDARPRTSGQPVRGHAVPYSWPSGAFPEMIVTAVEVTDAAGDLVWHEEITSMFAMDAGITWQDSGVQRVASCYSHGLCSACGTAAFIRHVIAFKPYHRDVRFVLENVPVPSLSGER
jgi:hypothetical protein